MRLTRDLPKMTSILFVCHGNICRSPMAEFILKRLVEIEHREKDFYVESAATSTEETGNPVYPPAQRVLARHGIGCAGKRARQMNVRDFEKFDYIILMDENNLRNLRRILPPEIYRNECAAFVGKPFERRLRKVSLLLDYTDAPRDVADPWYTGDFDKTWNDIFAGCSKLLEALSAQNGKGRL